MAHITEDRVLETTTTSGTGALTLAGAVTGFRTFASVMTSPSDTCLYALWAVDADGNATGDYEEGLGTYSASNTLTRTTVFRSSNANAAVTLAAGTKYVAISLLQLQSVTPSQITANQNDYSPTGMASAGVLLLSCDQARAITGFATGWDRRELWLVNASTNADGDLILRSENTGSSAANRILADNDVVMEPGETTLLRYEAATSRWRPIGGRRKFTGSTFRLTPYIWTDFFGAATADTGEASYAPWDVSLISTGTQSKVAGLANHPGILRFTSSTTTNSGAYCRTDASAFLIAGGEVSEHVFRLPDLTTLTARLGFIDTATSSDCTDGVYIEIPSTGAAVGKTSSNSTRTTSSTIASLSANTWYRARIVVNKTATAVDFYIFDDNGNQLGTQQNTANIPTATGRETGHGYIATKSGTTAQGCIDMDFMSIEFTRALI